MNQHDDDDAVPDLKGYDLNRAPERDLWPGISARLAPRRPRWQQAFSYAAAAVVVVGLAVNLLLSLNAPRTGAPATAVTRVATLAAQPVRPLRSHDDNRMLVRANLKIVDDAEKQLLQALRSAPDSAYLKRLLESTKGQKRDLRRLLARPV